MKEKKTWVQKHLETFFKNFHMKKKNGDSNLDQAPLNLNMKFFYQPQNVSNYNLSTVSTQCPPIDHPSPHSTSWKEFKSSADLQLFAE